MACTAAAHQGATASSHLGLGRPGQHHRGAGSSEGDHLDAAKRVSEKKMDCENAIRLGLLPPPVAAPERSGRRRLEIRVHWQSLLLAGYSTALAFNEMNWSPGSLVRRAQ